MMFCANCNCPCDTVTVRWKERDEFWGAPCWRDCYEDVSDCCNAETHEIEELDEEVML